MLLDRSPTHLGADCFPLDRSHRSIVFALAVSIDFFACNNSQQIFEVTTTSAAQIPNVLNRLKAIRAKLIFQMVADPWKLAKI